MWQIHKIQKADLPKLEPLLKASFGELFVLQDEVDYFNDMPHDSWFYLSEQDYPLGIIRCFEVK